MDTKSGAQKEQTLKDYEKFSLLWQGIEITVKRAPEYYPGVIAHLEVQSAHDERLPITTTGYRSHFCKRAEVEEYDDPVAYVQARLEHMAEKPEWKAYLKTKNIQSLF